MKRMEGILSFQKIIKNAPDYVFYTCLSRSIKLCFYKLKHPQKIDNFTFTQACFKLILIE